MNILIVEDYAEGAETFKDLLEVLGHTAQYVTCGAQVGSLLQQESFQLVFMDINLPDISGIELLAALKQDLPPEVMANTRFVAVSGYSSADAQGRLATEVFDYYIEKPIELANLDKILALPSLEFNQ